MSGWLLRRRVAAEINADRDTGALGSVCEDHVRDIEFLPGGSSVRVRVRVSVSHQEEYFILDAAHVLNEVVNQILSDDE